MITHMITLLQLNLLLIVHLNFLCWTLYKSVQMANIVVKYFLTTVHCTLYSVHVIFNFYFLSNSQELKKKKKFKYEFDFNSKVSYFPLLVSLIQ